MISLIHKKGVNTDPKNFRPVALIHCVSKIITKIVRERANARYHAVVSKFQFGFKQGVGTIDPIYVLRQILKNTKIPIHALFLDLRGAFDKLPRKLLMKIIEIMLGSKKLAELLTEIHTNTTAKLKDGKMEINIESGVRQGSDEGPICFNLFFDYVLQVCEREISEKVPDFGVENI